MTGKYYWFAPEQVVGAPADARTDVYAVGTVLYQALTGTFLRISFGDSDFDLLEATRRGTLPAPLLADPALAPFERVLRRALEREPSNRFASAEELRHALRELQTAFPGDARAFWALQATPPPWELAALTYRGKLPPHVVINVGCGVCDGLMPMHTRGQAHGRVSPMSIFVTPDSVSVTQA